MVSLAARLLNAAVDALKSFVVAVVESNPTLNPMIRSLRFADVARVVAASKNFDATASRMPENVATCACAGVETPSTRIDAVIADRAERLDRICTSSDVGDPRIDAVREHP